MRPYTTGRYAFGYCHYCGQRWPLEELRNEVVNLIVTGKKACPDCWSADHPQLQVGRTPVDDPQALKDPRPEDNLEVSRGLFGWSPMLGESCLASLGQVYFQIS